MQNKYRYLMSTGTHGARFEAAGLPSSVYVYQVEMVGQRLGREMPLVK